MAERPTKAERGHSASGPDYFDQHSNIMAVLTDALPVAQQKPVLQRIMADTSLGQATYYYRFYLLEAIHKTGADDLLAPALAPWKELLTDGLSTTPERYESPENPTRSECHPWSKAPAYAFFSTIAGIRPAEVGFRQLTMTPAFDELTHIEGTYPHPAGELVFALDRKGPGGLSGTVTLPRGVSGTLRWRGKEIALREGAQSVHL